MTAVLLPLSIGAPAGPGFLVKDCIDVAGHPTRMASRALAGAQPAAAHAEVVERMLAAGWKLCGKANMHELAFGTTGINGWTGTPVNPGWPDRVPGGSSSGSAVAVAAGLVPVALGTDTGGSIRTPAACCNVFGLKPSFGRVSRRGVLPAHSSLDCVGPLAADMEWLVRAMQAICPGFTSLPALTGSVALGTLAFDGCEWACGAIESALDATPCRRLPLRLAWFDEAYAAGLAIIGHEALQAYGDVMRSGLLGRDIQARLEQVAAVPTAKALGDAERVRARFRAEVDALLEQCDALALPSMPAAPPLLSLAADTAAAVSMTRLVRPFNLSGHPAISLPLLAGDGLPVGLQLVGRHGQDEHLCAVAQAVSRSLPIRTGVPA